MPLGWLQLPHSTAFAAAYQQFCIRFCITYCHAPTDLAPPPIATGAKKMSVDYGGPAPQLAHREMFCCLTFAGSALATLIDDAITRLG